MGVTLSYSQVYGSEPTWDDFQKAISEYSLEQIVDIVTRISVSLYKARLPFDPQAQHAICLGVFGGAGTARILETVERVDAEMRQEGRRAPLLALNEPQTLNLLKAAFILKSLDDEDRSSGYENLGKALLMITDLTQGDPGNLEDADQSDPEFLDRWLRYLLANGLFSSGRVGSFELARSYDLYMTTHENIASHPSYVDLPRSIEDVTGLEPDVLWAATFALAAHWLSLPVDDIGNQAMSLSRATHFTRNYSFSQQESDRFLRAMTRPPSSRTEETVLA